MVEEYVNAVVKYDNEINDGRQRNTNYASRQKRLIEDMLGKEQANKSLSKAPRRSPKKETPEQAQMKIDYDLKLQQNLKKVMLFYPAKAEESKKATPKCVTTYGMGYEYYYVGISVIDSNVE